MRDLHATNAVVAEAVAAIEAQAIVEGLQGDTLTPDHAWLGFVQVAARFGWRSGACRAFVCELAKRAAGAR